MNLTNIMLLISEISQLKHTIHKVLFHLDGNVQNRQIYRGKKQIDDCLKANGLGYVEAGGWSEGLLMNTGVLGGCLHNAEHTELIELYTSSM